ncbi:uncharacterized protein [Arachis hypogaea]|uniref:uncharacterized protein n=1 Tax=Arachis hypogaea TaxID=3818 RepID=UPI000DEC0DE8|nr:uncharacterized protein LOC112794867 [Arachis hypogaea]
MQREISCIVQRDGETLYEYWERFKKLLEACPHHRIDELVLISYFCQGMHHQDKLLLDAASGASLTKNKTVVEAWEVISDLVDSTQHSRARSPQPKAFSEVSPSGDVILTKTLGEMTILLRQITQGQQIRQVLINAPAQPPLIEGPSRICGVCACNTHYTDECPQIQEDTTLVVAKPYPQRPNYNQGSYPQGGNQSQGWRDNSNQRWNQVPQAQPNQNAQVYYHQHPQGQPQYQQPYQQPPHPQSQVKYQHSNSRSNPSLMYQVLPSNQSHMNDTFHTFMQEQRVFHKKQDVYMATIAESLILLTLPPETTQSTQQDSTSRSLPSQPQPNPKGSINAITLRSGTKLDKNVAIPSKLSKETNNEEVEDEVEVMKGEDKNVDTSKEEPPKVKEPRRKTLLEEPLPIPFQTLAKKAKKQEDLDPTMVKVFEKVEVIVPLFQVIQQVPKYAKFLKDVCTHKDKVGNLNKNW